MASVNEAARAAVAKHFSKHTRGDKIKAIKDVMEAADCNLKAAKDAVELAVKASTNTSRNIGRSN